MEKINNQIENDLLMVSEDEDTLENRFMIFVLDKEDYGISIKNVIEIVEMQKIIDVPDMPHYIKGIINLRGKIIPIMDLRLRFNIAAKEYDDRTCIIITNIEDYRVGLIVDRVEEVIEIAENNIEPPPKFKTGKGEISYISGLGKVGEKVKIILDVAKLLDQVDLEQIDIDNIEGGN
jgi:purine-binding chemotaxis protein CheW